MYELLPFIEAAHRTNTACAVATVARTWGSSPRQVGAKLVLTAAGEVAGSVSGGCIEGAVLETCEQVLAGAPPQLLHFGVADETAWAVGLACGGEVDVWVEAWQPVLDELATMLAGRVPVSCLTVMSGPHAGQKMLIAADGARHGSLGAAAWDEAALPIALATLAAERSTVQSLALTDDDALELLVESYPPPRHLVIVGAVHIAEALVPIAKLAGFRVSVVDPRTTFLTTARFPDADALIAAWPDEALPTLGLDYATAVVLLTHDPKLDDPAALAALGSPVRYIGALGSRRTQERRRNALREQGSSDADLARIHGPVGLNIGAVTPAEIAVSILAEIIAVWRKPA